MFLPNDYVLEANAKAAKRLQETNSETPKDFVPIGVLIYLVVE